MQLLRRGVCASHHHVMSWCGAAMTTLASTNLYKHHRFPGEIISHAVWLYFRFPLSHRDVEELLFERGVVVTYEAIRQWCRKFGQAYANQLRRRRPQPGDKWHLDEGAPRTHSQRAGVRCCTGDEGGPLGAGLQEQAPNRLKLHALRALVVSGEEKAGV